MNILYEKKRVKLLLGFLLLAGLNSCGSNKNNDKDPKTHAKFASQIIDSGTGNSVKNVEVFIKLDDKVYKDKTNSKGEYKFYVPVIEVKGRNDIVMEIYSDKYRCKAVSFQSIDANTTYHLTKDDGTISKHPHNVLKYSDMKKAGTLHHLGDDNYEGSYNSRFQLQTEGLAFGENVLKFNLTEQMITQYNSIEITFLAKGVQRQNRIELINTQTKEVVRIAIMHNSNANGTYSPYKFNLDVNGLEVGEYFFQIKSVRYNDGSDFDDFEFVSFYSVLK